MDCHEWHRLVGSRSGKQNWVVKDTYCISYNLFSCKKISTGGGCRIIFLYCNCSPCWTHICMINCLCNHYQKSLLLLTGKNVFSSRIYTRNQNIFLSNSCCKTSSSEQTWILAAWNWREAMDIYIRAAPKVTPPILSLGFDDFLIKLNFFFLQAETVWMWY